VRSLLLEARDREAGLRNLLLPLIAVSFFYKASHRVTNDAIKFHPIVHIKPTAARLDIIIPNSLPTINLVIRPTLVRQKILVGRVSDEIISFLLRIACLPLTNIECRTVFRTLRSSSHEFTVLYNPFNLRDKQTTAVNNSNNIHSSFPQLVEGLARLTLTKNTPTTPPSVNCPSLITHHTSSACQRSLRRPRQSRNFRRRLRCIQLERTKLRL
jgi:hypothetical protein